MNPAELRDEVTRLVSDYPHPQAALVPALHLLRERGDPISNEALTVLADVCSVDVRQVSELVGHYSVFQNASEPHPSLCLGLICYLNGAREIFDHLKADSTSCDERLKGVKVSPCLGYCYAGPVLKLPDGTLCKITHSN